MSTAREAILSRIRDALGERDPAAPPVETGNIRPAFEGDRVSRFVNKLTAAAAGLTRVTELAAVPPAVDAYLREHSLPPALVVAEEPPLSELPWPDGWDLAHRAARGEDRVSLTGAFAAIGETGSLVMLSGPGHPTTLNFLPDDHLVVLREQKVVAHMEDVWALLRERPGGMPRTVNIITGPSRTADVEQTIQLGAHGPRRLHVFLVAE